MYYDVKPECKSSISCPNRPHILTLSNISLYLSELTRVSSSELVSRPDLVLTSLQRPGVSSPWGPQWSTHHPMSHERLCVTAPAPETAYTR